MPLLQTKPLLDAWITAPWQEFVNIADSPDTAKLKSYYYNGRMRVEPKSTSCDHSRDQVLVLLALSVFAVSKNIPITAKNCCSYRKRGYMEFQPDASYYVGANADVIPWGTRIIDLDQYPLPDLVIEISDTSFADDLGTKRLQYEDLGISEYWIINVQTMQIFAFTHGHDGSIRRIRESLVLTGLKLEILEQALQRSRQENQSTITAWLMDQFRT